MRTFNRQNIENLTEVKAGQTGNGLLIEHDGHIIGKKDKHYCIDFAQKFR